MTFGQAVTSGFRRYFDFEGRSSRAEYWFWNLFCFIIVLIISFIQYSDKSNASVYDALGGLFTIATFIPSLSVLVRRLHDVDRSGWWYLIAFTIVGVIPLLYWFCKAGDEGPNRFGNSGPATVVEGPAISTEWER